MINLELLGMSRAGKTTQKQMLKEEFSLRGLDAHIIQRPKVPFSKFGSLYCFHDYLADYFGEELDKNVDRDVNIVDRGANDRKILLGLDYCDGNISRQEYRELKSKLDSVSAKTDLCFLFMVSPKESISRWKAQKEAGLDFSYLNDGLPSWDNYQDLKRLHNAYVPLVGGSGVIYIDGTGAIKNNFQRIMEEIENAKRS